MKGVATLSKVKKQLLTLALIVAALFTIRASAQGEVAGTALTTGETPLAGATVEAWDEYPGGTVLAAGTSDADGAFALANLGTATFDLRVTKDGYYPTVIRDLPHPVTNALLALAPFTPASRPVFQQEYFDDASTFLDAPIQPGDVIEARDPDGVLAGSSQEIPAPGLYTITVRGEDADSGDQGALPGDLIDFYINGLLANPEATWNAGLLPTQHHLTGATQAPGVTLVGPADRGVFTGDVSIVSYLVTNTGTVSETFDISAAIDPAWTVSLLTSSSVGPLDPGESAQIDVRVETPGDAGSQSAELTVLAASAGYQSANSGAFTILDVSTTGVSDYGSDEGLLPHQFSLAQNYPNPFNPETVIAFNMAAPGHVRLEVFNIVGQSVTTLVDEFRDAGRHVVEWQGRDRSGAQVPSGIYFYRLHQGNETQTRQMVLLR
jgi:hypothetical protein